MRRCILFFGFWLLCFVYAHAQCTVLADKPLTGIGVSAVFVRKDTTIINSIWQAHKQDKVLEFKKPARGARSGCITVLRQDGHVQGIYADKDLAYFFSADSLADTKSQTQSYTQRKLRSIWYLSEGDSIADDESYLFITAMHLGQVWPIKGFLAGDGKVSQRVFAQGSTYEECQETAFTYVGEVCGPTKKTRKTNSRYCDDGKVFTGALDFVCAPSFR